MKFRDTYPLDPHGVNRSSPKQSYAIWEKNVQSGVLPEDMISGAERYRNHIKAQVARGFKESVKASQVFLGPGRHWETPWVDERAPRGSEGLGRGAADW